MSTLPAEPTTGNPSDPCSRCGGLGLAPLKSMPSVMAPCPVCRPFIPGASSTEPDKETAAAETAPSPPWLAEIRARADAASPGPWREYRRLVWSLPLDASVLTTRDRNQEEGALGRAAQLANARFVAHAREDVPMLLGMLADADARIAAAVEAEREACAAAVEDTGVVTHTPGGYEDNEACGSPPRRSTTRAFERNDARSTLRNAAAAIRARGGK